MFLSTLLGSLAVIYSLLLKKASASACCSQVKWQVDSTGHTNQTIGDRSFYVHIPSNYDSCVPHPVVLSFHGENGTETEQELISGFSQNGLTINNTDIIAVYPLATWGPGKDGGGATCAWQGAPYANPGVNDIAFVETIISELEENLCIDPNRIYAAGKSNGGGLTHLLACTNSTASLIAAYAPVSAALYPETFPFGGCNASSDTPLINFHGSADTVIPYGGQPSDNTGNTSYALPNITIWREAWAARDSCVNAQNPDMTDLASESTELYTWTCSPPRGGGNVNGFTVIGLGHSWPSTQGLDGAVTTFNATNQYIMPFFAANALSQPFNYTINGTSGSGSQTGSPSSAGSSAHTTHTHSILLFIALFSVCYLSDFFSPVYALF